MTTLSLRGYNREIESLIDIGELDQAVAHCRQILKYFPKHVETYRLLAKSYLENKRLGDAADIFQRVLSSIPEDFVSHIGMSIIREDEGNLDASIWHMARAFEVQPSNVTIQDELRRLYGKRDGVEPPRIRLSRGALARMYARGNLMEQAIGELRVALSESPERLDLQVLLAHMYYQNKQRVKTAQICSQIISKLPYCLDANLLLTTVLKETNRESEISPHIERVKELDPYLTYVDEASPSVDLIPEETVVVDKLDWNQSQTDLRLQAQPAWATSAGVEIPAEIDEEEEVPDWMLPADESSPEKPTDETDSLPEWILPENFDEAELAAQSEDVPPDLGGATSEIESTDDEEDLPEWMLPEDKAAEIEMARTEDDADLPDWMLPEDEASDDGMEFEEDDVILPDWMLPEEESPVGEDAEAETTDFAEWMIEEEPAADLELDSEGTDTLQSSIDEIVISPDQIDEDSGAEDRIEGTLPEEESFPGLDLGVPEESATETIPGDTGPGFDEPSAEEDEDDSPDWLVAADETLPGLELEAAVESAMEPIPEDISPVEDEPTAEDEDLSPDWHLAAEDTLPGPELEAAAESATETIPGETDPDFDEPTAEEDEDSPDWLVAADETLPGLDLEAAGESTTTPEDTTSEDDVGSEEALELPDWLLPSSDAPETDEAILEPGIDTETTDELWPIDDGTGDDAEPEGVDPDPLVFESLSELDPGFLDELEPEETGTGISQDDIDLILPELRDEDIPDADEGVDIHPDADEAAGSAAILGGILAGAAEDSEPEIDELEDGDQLPGFLQEAGWAPRDPDLTEEAPTDFASDDEDFEKSTASSDQDIVPAEIPEWIQQLAPPEPQFSSGLATPNQEENKMTDENDLPDWLTSDDDEDLPTEAQEESQSTSDTPDWLKELGDEADVEDTAPTVISESESEESDAVKAVIPDWLQDLEPASEPGDDMPDGAEESAVDWLLDMDPTGPDPIRPTLEGERTGVTKWLDNLDEDQPEPDIEDIPESPAVLGSAGTGAEVSAEEPEILGIEDGTEIPEWLTSAVQADDEPQGVETIDFSDGDTKITSRSSMGGIPQDEPEGVQADTPTEDEIDLPDWVQEAAATTEEPATVETDLPEWVEEAEATTEEPEIIETDEPDFVQEAEATTEGPATVETDLPEWVQETEATTEEPATVETDVPDWVQEIEATAEEPETIETDLPDFVQEAEATAEEPETVETDLPEWLKEEDLRPIDTPEQQEVADWLEDSAELLPTDVSTGEDVPEWLQEVEAAADSVDEEAEEEIPDWVQAAAEADEAVPETGDDVEVATTPTEETDGVEEPEPEMASTVPSWLQGFEEELLPADTDIEVESVEETEVEFELSDLEPEKGAVSDSIPAEDQLPDLEDQDAAMAWLESLAAKQGADETELLTTPEERSEAPPDWVTEFSDATEFEAPPEGGIEPAEEELMVEPSLETEAESFEEFIPDSPELETPEVPEFGDEMEGFVEEQLEPMADSTSEAGTIEESLDFFETEIEAPEVSAPVEGIEDADAEAIMDELEKIASPGMEDDTLISSPSVVSDLISEAAEEDETGMVDIPDYEAEELAATQIEEPAQIEEVVEEVESPGFDADAALAWLESLAAKQGVPEEELLTTPEDREEQTPDWVQSIVDEDQTAGTVEDLSPVDEADVAAEVSTTEEEVSLEWLQELDSEGDGEAADEVDEPEIPEWLQAEIQTEETETDPSKLIAFSMEDTMPGLKRESEMFEEAEEELEEIPETETEAEPISGKDADLPDWIDDLELEEVEEVEEVEFDDLEVEEVQEVEEVEFDDLELEEVEEVEEVEFDDLEVEEVQEVEEVEEADFDVEELEWELEDEPVLEIGEADDELEDEVIGFEIEEDFGGDTVLEPGPVEADELSLMAGEEGEEIQSDLESAEADWMEAELDEEPAEVQFEPESALEDAAASPRDEFSPAPQILSEAREALENGEVSLSMLRYGELIEQGSSLDLVIQDLVGALDYKYPVDIEIWKTLGDVHAKAEHLQDALDSYTKAEDLLR